MLKQLTLLTFILTLGACAAEVEDLTTEDLGEMDLAEDGKDDSTAKSFKLAAGKTTKLAFKATSTPVVLTINCGPPSDPDAIGPVFALDAPTLGAWAAKSTERAGYFRWAGKLAAGTHAVNVLGRMGSATCKVSLTKQAASQKCLSRAEWRSSNTNHEHIRVGEDASFDWEEFPASGSHWGAWPMWNRIYEKPVKTGFLLHGLEHGGLAVSSKSETKAELDAVTALVTSFQKATPDATRLFVTPDPKQPAAYAIRGWRWAYVADCVDEKSALSFMTAHFRHGREDIDADPPIPFDPTTTTVPCENLMAAPDSCN